MKQERTPDGAVELGLLGLRLWTGSVMAGHGAQKLFGSFGGYGLEGTAGWLESLGLQPGKPWAVAAGLSESGGGALTALGLLHPLGPLGTIGAMAVAARKAHWNKPIWVTSGGAELPAINIAVAAALLLAGPGKYSLDEVFGIRLPRWVIIPGLLSIAATVAVAARMEPPAGEEDQDEARDELQAEGES